MGAVPFYVKWVRSTPGHSVVDLIECSDKMPSADLGRILDQLCFTSMAWVNYC